MCGGSFGSGPFGSMGFGSGSGLGVRSAEEIALNAIRVTFSEAPQASDPATAWDALNPENWTVEPLSPVGAITRLVQDVQPGELPEQILVYMDGSLSAPGLYRITVAGTIRDLGGGTISSECLYADFETFRPARVPPGATLDTSRYDVANPQTRAALLGTYQINDRGDYANESGRAYLRKRVIRRATSALASFFHLPNYGFAARLKGLIRPADLRRMQTAAEQQIAEEPDVAGVRARARQHPQNPSVVILDLRVKDTLGGTLEIAVPIDFAG